MPKTVNRNDLFKLWLMATRHDVDAQRILHHLTNIDPRIEATLKEFVAERARREKSKAAGANSPAGKRSAKPSKTVVHRLRTKAKAPREVPDHKRPHEVPEPGLTPWEKMSGGASGWVSIVSGGLPSLGKRR